MDRTTSAAYDKLKFKLDRDKETLRRVFLETESAESPSEIKQGFDKVNDYMRWFLRLPKGRDFFKTVRIALETIGTTKKFSANLQKAGSLEEAIIDYKTELLQELSFQLRKREIEDIKNQKQDQDLINFYFPKLIQGESRKESKVDETPSENRKRKRVTDENEERKKVCHSYQRRKCHRGDKCYYKHIDAC